MSSQSATIKAGHVLDQRRRPSLSCQADYQLHKQVKIHVGHHKKQSTKNRVRTRLAKMSIKNFTKKPQGNNSTNQPNGLDQKCGWGSSQISITVQSHLTLLGEFSLPKSSHLYWNLQDRKFLQRFPCANFPKGSRCLRKFQKTALF